MKNFTQKFIGLLALVFVPFTFLGQNTAYIEQDVPLELQAGWNMFGYSCYEPMELIQAFTPIADKIVIVKNNQGNVYMPEFSFNGIGNLEYNRGYQIKTTEAITDFQFCPAIIAVGEVELGCTDESGLNFNPNANINDGSCVYLEYGCTDPSYVDYNPNAVILNSNQCMETNAMNYNPNASESLNCCFIPLVAGCMDDTAFNYNASANMDDGSCLYLGCMDSEACNYNEQATTDDGTCEYAQEGYDCEGNITEYFVGMESEGGIVFYVDETGQHGLVAAIEDLGQFSWGCMMTELIGAGGTVIGSGHQNTIDIVSECSETPIAASATLAYESGGYSDWYLPSRDELSEMYYTIGEGSSNGNIGDFSYTKYFSSTEYGNSSAWWVDFNSGNTSYIGNVKATYYKVRPIRSF